ncbi:MAG: TetR/AcrR family transcriptional regulator [Lachnospiraceae bacterium]|nr:TetR/AcrR family transcriptional regulator [Lachnospiraceae bacterium]
MGRRDDKKIHKRNNLFSTAFELFTTKGFSQTSIADIVERAEVAKGTFYLYFKDKYDLREKLIVNRAQKLFDHAIEYSGYREKENFEDKLIAIVDDILNSMENEPKLTAFITKNVSWAVFHKSLSRSDEDSGYNYLKLLEEEIKKETVPYHDVEIMLFMIIEMVSATGYNAIVDREPVDLKAYKPFLHGGIRNIMKGFKDN